MADAVSALQRTADDVVYRQTRLAVFDHVGESGLEPADLSRGQERELATGHGGRSHRSLQGMGMVSGRRAWAEAARRSGK
ncbi:hypothetical protein GCM10010251_58900 [Streptomyces aurantiogriseus]|uniref:Uncharacterized protein n=1 Tax=Streptomyces aurantiogriseus TaxID=66870 RepID=A0A918KV66_9ACTN|nr:hypothetical protein GCM10010251_58900 [Streptomyces aurantiogriseus]